MPCRPRARPIAHARRMPNVRNDLPAIPATRAAALPSATHRTPVARAPQHLTGAALTLLGLAAIAWLTLRPVHGEPRREFGLCLVCGSVGGVDVLLNVLLFAPLGAGLALLGARWWRALLVALAVTSLVELAQMHVVVGRDASLGDVVANALGGLAGYLAARRWRLFAAPTRGEAGRLAIAGGLAWVAIQALAAAGLRPARSDAPYHVQLRPVLRAGFDVFRGRVDAASADDVALPPGRIAAGLLARTRLADGTARLSTTVVTSAFGSRRPAPIVRVVDAERHTREMLMQRGHLLLFETRLGAARARFRAPVVGIAGIFPNRPGAEHVAACAPGTRLHLEGAWEAGWYRLRAEGPGCGGAVAVPLRPSLGWTMLLPFPYAVGPGVAGPSMLWLAALLLPWSFWSGRARGPVVRWLGWSAAMVATGLLVVPAGAGLPPSAWWEWLTALASVAAGLALGRRTAASEAPAPGSAAVHSTEAAANVY